MSIDTVADWPASSGGLRPRTVSCGRGERRGQDQTRARLTQLAAEFESMLLLQMLKEMRKSGSWEDEGEDAERLRRRDDARDD